MKFETTRRKQNLKMDMEAKRRNFFLKNRNWNPNIKLEVEKCKRKQQNGN